MQCVNTSSLNNEREVDVNDKKSTKPVNTDNLLNTCTERESIHLADISKDNTHVSKYKNVDDQHENKTDNQETEKCKLQCMAESRTGEIDTKDHDERIRERVRNIQTAMSKSSFSSFVNEVQELKKTSQESSVCSTKENVNPYFDKTDSKIDKINNWSQDNWSSIHCEDESPPDNANFKIKSIKNKKSQVLTSLFGDDDDSYDNDSDKHDSETIYINEGESHMVREANEKKSEFSNKDKSLKCSLHTGHIDNITNESIQSSSPWLPKGCALLKQGEPYTKDDTGETTMQKRSQSVIGKDEGSSKSVGTEKSKRNHHEVHLQSIDMFSKTEPRNDKKVEEIKSSLDFYSLFGDVDSTEAKGVKSKYKSSKQEAESSHTSKGSLSKDRRHDKEKETKNWKDNYKSSASSEDFKQAENNEAEDGKYKSRSQLFAMCSSISKESHPQAEAKKGDNLEGKISKTENIKLKDSKSHQSKQLESRSSHSKTNVKNCTLVYDKDDEGYEKKQALFSKLFGNTVDIESANSSDYGMKEIMEKKEGLRVDSKDDWTVCVKSFGKYSKEYGDIGKMAEKHTHIQEEKLSKHLVSEIDLSNKDKNEDKRSTSIDEKKSNEFRVEKSQDKTEAKDAEKLACLRPVESKADAVPSHSRQITAPGHTNTYKPQSASSGDTKKDDLRLKKIALEVKVVEEVKKWLDPYYRDKSVNKEEYKQIVAKCVKKVVTAECGDIIESEKMRGLVDGYVVLYKHRRTKLQLTSSN